MQICSSSCSVMFRPSASRRNRYVDLDTCGCSMMFRIHSPITDVAGVSTGTWSMRVDRQPSTAARAGFCTCRLRQRRAHTSSCVARSLSASQRRRCSSVRSPLELELRALYLRASAATESPRPELAELDLHAAAIWSRAMDVNEPATARQAHVATGREAVSGAEGEAGRQVRGRSS
jgi:hypothetical protein